MAAGKHDLASTSARSAFVRLAAFYVASFAVLGVFLPFMPAWLRDRGCDAAQIGWVMAAGEVFPPAANFLA